MFIKIKRFLLLIFSIYFLYAHSMLHSFSRAASCEQAEQALGAVSHGNSSLANTIALWIKDGKDWQKAPLESRLVYLAMAEKPFQLRKELAKLTVQEKKRLGIATLRLLDDKSRFRQLSDKRSLGAPYNLLMARERISILKNKEAAAYLDRIINNISFNSIPVEYRNLLLALRVSIAEKKERNHLLQKIKGAQAKNLRGCFLLDKSIPETVSSIKKKIKTGHYKMMQQHRYSGLFKIEKENQDILMAQFFISPKENHFEIKDLVKKTGLLETLFLSDGSGIYWPLKSKKNTFMKTPHGVRGLSTFDVEANLFFNFFSKNIGGGLNFRFFIAKHQSVFPNPGDVLAQLLEVPFLGTIEKNNIYFYPLFEATPFSKTSFHVKLGTGGLPSSIIIDNSKDKKLIFDNFLYAEKAKPILPKILKGKKILETELAFTENIFNESIINNVVSRETEKNLPEQKELNITEKMYSELNARSFVDSGFLLSLADKYSKYISDFSPEFAFKVARLYANGYRNEKAIAIMENAFAKKEAGDLKTSDDFQIQLGSGARNEYVNSLIMVGDYRTSIDYNDYRIRQAKKTKNFSKLFNLIGLHADILFRAGRPKAASNLLASTLSMHSSEKIPEKLVLLEIYIQLLSYQKRFSEAQKALAQWKSEVQNAEAEYKKNSRQRYFVLEQVSNPEKSAMRISHPPTIPGQGENFCAPIALEFSLKLLGRKNVDQKQIALDLETDNKGTNFSQIFKYLDLKKVPYSVATLSAQEIGNLISKNKPVLSLLTPPSAPNSHISVIIGVDVSKKVYYFYEPGLPFTILAIDEKELRQSQVVTGPMYLVLGKRGKENSKELAARMAFTFLDKYTSGNDGQAQLNILQKVMEADREKEFQEFLAFHHLRTLLNLSRLKQLTRGQYDYISKLYSEMEHSEYKKMSFLIYRTMADLALHSGRVPLALKFYNLSLKENPHDFYSLLNAGDIELKTGDFDKGVELIDKMLLNRPALNLHKGLHQGIIMNVANAYLKKGMNKRAVETLMNIVSFSNRTEKTSKLLQLIRENEYNNSLLFLKEVTGYSVEE